MGPLHRLLAAAALAAGLAAAGIAAASNVAYTSLGPSTSHVWVMEGDGSDKDRLTTGSVNDFGPVISPSGSPARLRAPAHRPARRPLAPRRRRHDPPAAHEHRRRRGESRLGAGRRADRVRVPGRRAPVRARRRRARRHGQAPAHEQHASTTSTPRGRADSNRIAFTRYVTRTNAEIYTIAAAGGSLRRLTDHRAADHSPDFSSTGWIAWVRSHASGSQIRLVRADGSGRRLLFSTPRAVTAPTWSPNGARLAFELWDGEDTELYVIAFDGTGLRRLTNNDVGDFGPVWGPGSGRIAFTRFTTTSNDVWSMAPERAGQAAPDDGDHPRLRRGLGRGSVTLAAWPRMS